VNAHFFERIAQLERTRERFAIATVVAREAPVSSHVGDRALVFADGRMEGFVGGSCSRDLVRRQALGAIRSRLPVLLQIRNGEPSLPSVAAPVGESECCRSDDRAASVVERIVIPMSCASEGAVDVYIEPRVPERQLVVVGYTPVADALARMAAALDYDVVRVVAGDELRDIGPQAGERVIELTDFRAFIAALEPAECESLVAIVASQGHYDELALETLQAFDTAFVGLLASRRRAATVFGVLAQQGVAPDRIAMIRNPVGLDIGARSAGDVAVSILAEIVANLPLSSKQEAPAREPRAVPVQAAPGNAAHGSAQANTATAVDPVCGMDVDVASALHRFERDGQTFIFCCAGCRASFTADPERYVLARGNA
jgi:xanthine dehydrogenase accessory factor